MTTGRTPPSSWLMNRSVRTASILRLFLSASQYSLYVGNIAELAGTAQNIVSRILGRCTDIGWIEPLSADDLLWDDRFVLVRTYYRLTEAGKQHALAYVVDSLSLGWRNESRPQLPLALAHLYDKSPQVITAQAVAKRVGCSIQSLLPYMVEVANLGWCGKSGRGVSAQYCITPDQMPYIMELLRLTVTRTTRPMLPPRVRCLLAE